MNLSSQFIKLLGKIFIKQGHLSIRVGQYLHKFNADLYHQNVRKWFEIEGDKSLRVNYDLDDKSLVLDVGGYEGQWSSEIFSRYCCRILIFEPVPHFAARITTRFARNPKITVFPFGLASQTMDTGIAVNGDGSSVFRRYKGVVEYPIKLIAAKVFFEQNQLGLVDLMKINIEGGEYELLEHLIDTGLISRIQQLQVQFHNFVPNAEARMHSIQKRLEQTHVLTYQYSFVWENWALKSLS
jgi:FkbM family methyltransferase